MKSRSLAGAARAALLLVWLPACVSNGASAPPPPPPRPAPQVAAPLSGASHTATPAAGAESESIWTPPSRENAPSQEVQQGQKVRPSEEVARAKDAAPQTPAPVAAPAAADPKSSDPPPPAAAPAPESEGAKANRAPSSPLGWVAGDPIAPEELLLEWGDVASRELYLLVDKLVSTRLALLEAARIGIRLAPEEVEQRFLADRAKLEAEIARNGKSRTLEDFIRKDLGFEPELYLERVRRGTIRQMLAERVVRTNALQSESVALRLIIVPDEEQMKAVQAALAQGGDFAELARQYSVDDSKERGGLVPFVVAQERSPLARLALATPVGEIAGPIPSADHQFLIRVEEHRSPLSGDWATLAPVVESSLSENPVTDSEYLNWKLAMEGRYPIDLGPLKKLIGAARQ